VSSEDLSQVKLNIAKEQFYKRAIKNHFTKRIYKQSFMCWI